MLAIAGCSQHEADALLANYQWRMGNALAVSIEPANNLPAVVYPRRRDLQLDIPAVKINLLQFLRLSQCELQRLLGERNSNLGRLMPASQQLVYQQQFMQLAEACLSQLVVEDSGRDLQQALRKALASKQEHLPALVWNATFASDEFRHLLGSAHTPSGLDDGVPSELLNALANVLELVAQGRDANWQPVESYLQIIGADTYGGQLVLSQQRLLQMLAPVTQALEAATAAHAVCPQGRTTPQARILQNVFYKYYIGQVQPYIAQVYQHSAALQKRLAGLYTATDSVASPAFTRYWNATWANDSDSVWQDFLRQVAAHTVAWQQQLQQCGMRPGA